MKWTLMAAALALGVPAAAQAQYAPVQYAPVQYYDGYRDRYYEPPPRPYYPPPRELGGQCEAAIPSGYGSRPLICPIIRARPLGRPCVCPAPPRFGGGSYEGRVIP